MDDRALREWAASERLRPQVFLIVAGLERARLFCSIQFSLAGQFDRTVVDGQYELVAGEKGWI